MYLNTVVFSYLDTKFNKNHKRLDAKVSKVEYPD